MEKSKDIEEVPRTGLGILPSNRPVTRSISRALENQVVGSLLTQIDTGIVYPVDFVPVDYLNRCTARIFGQPSNQAEQQQSLLLTDQINVTDNSLSFSRKLERVLEMSEPTQGGVTSEGSIGGANPREEREATEAPVAPTADRIEQLGQMMTMMMQQNAVMSEVMNEVRKMRSDVSHLSNRVADVEASMPSPAMPTPLASTSTPDPQKLNEKGGGDMNRGIEVRDRPGFSERKRTDLDKWHLKFDGTTKGMTVESFVFRLERMRVQYQLSYDQLLADFHCLVTGQALKWYWQIMEDHAEDNSFDYHALKAELLAQFRAAETDYEVIREIMER